MQSALERVSKSLPLTVLLVVLAIGAALAPTDDIARIIAELPFWAALSLSAVMLTVGGLVLSSAASITEKAAKRLVRAFALAASVGGIAIGMGTSMPELFSSSLATISGHPVEFVIGALIGSNMANTGLVLAVAAFRPKPVGNATNARAFALPVDAARWHAFMAMFSLAAVSAMAVAGTWAGLAMVVTLPLAAMAVKRLLPKGGPRAPRVRHGRPILLLVAGLSAMAIAVTVLLSGVTVVDKAVGLPAALLGAIVAIITSAPEMLTSIPGVWRGDKTLAQAGDIVVSSNGFNTAICAVLVTIVTVVSLLTGTPIVVGYPVLALTASAAVGSFWILHAARTSRIGLAWAIPVCVATVVALAITAT